MIKIKLVLVFLLFFQFFAVGKKNQHPNIVLFLVDDMGLMDTSVPFITNEKGEAQMQELNLWYRTPNMERLASQGVRFSNFYAHSVCSPTRVSLLTGQNSARHRTTQYIKPESNNGGEFAPKEWNWQGLSASSQSIHKILKSAGYSTIHVGKAHFAPIGYEGANPINLGVDRNVAGCAIGMPGSYFGKDNYGAKIKKRVHRAVPGLESYHGTNTFLTEALTLEAKKELEWAVETENPFFMYLSHYAVHSPFQSDPRFKENYTGRGKRDNAVAFSTLIEGMDRSLGDLLDALEELGVAENTIVLFMGDNGSDAPIGNQNQIACSAPLRGKKGSQWEGGTRVPFIASWAQPNSQSSIQKQFPIKPGSIQQQMGACYDLFPTIASLASAPIPEDYTIDGVDLKKRCSGRIDKKASNEFLSHFPHWHRSNMYTSLRSGDWKVIYHYFPDREMMDSPYLLYNLKNDPSESIDLSKQNTIKLKEMMSLLTSSLKKHNALYPEVNGKEIRPECKDL